MSSEQQAKDLINQAQKKLNSWSFFGPSNKYEDAAELYEKAGNMFKLAQQWGNAGDAFVEAAKLFQRGNSAKFEGSRAYDNAAKCYKRSDVSAAVSALKEAVILDQEGGNFRAAARHYQDIAELCESADYDKPKEAYDAYTRSAELYNADDSPALANKCLLKVAQIAADMEMYDVAIEKYEQVAATAVDDPLLKWSLKEYFFKAGLCHLCTGDMVKTTQALSNYCNMDLSFEASREYTLLRGIIDCVDQGDVDQFTQIVYDYDKLSRLDPWKTAVLLKIKKSMESDELR
ncbi:soluble NSF attachment protein [Mycotypha africana]|uniref:soluble NSF attachment protein n=1 Tax=Mycotypha africana TaxID=64632 RepID=UPI0022FFE711|nr:soluble NSF attachment protein [Mycotypha africana]KAI8992136.1 soluble NSF attachment protein [Mycotypha africana]